MGAVLSSQERVLEILEIPQLMDAFIRNGNYEEAMELQTHVGRLVFRLICAMLHDFGVLIFFLVLFLCVFVCLF